MNSAPPNRERAPDDRGRFAIRLSLAVSFVMLAGKWFAFSVTESSAILSDAAESVVHIAATAIAAFSFWYASRPADAEHPYGHGRIAFFSAGFEGSLIFAAAISILTVAVSEWWHGPNPHNLGLGTWIVGSLGLINLLLGVYLIVVGKRTHSIVLVANGQHVLSDMWTSLGVVAGILAVQWTGARWLDPLIGILAGLLIGYNGILLMSKAYDGLMDRVSPVILSQIATVLDTARDRGHIADYHQLRFRTLENEVWIDVHLMLAGELALKDAHERVTAVEIELREALEQERVWVFSHLEPEDHLAAHPEGHEQLDPLRAASSPAARDGEV